MSLPDVLQCFFLASWADTAAFPLSLPQEAIHIRETVVGANSPEVAQSLHNLGLLYKKSSTLERAKAPLLRALEIREAGLGADHPDVANSCTSIGLLYVKQVRAQDKLQGAFRIGDGCLSPHVVDEL